jgi:hypothetical protein
MSEMQIAKIARVADWLTRFSMKDEKKPGKLIGDHNMRLMTFGVDMIVLGRDCGVSPSGSHIRSRSVT